ncbi:hypothetical protein [Polaribacter sp. Z022]|uniref:hypothetical protein n=1 Tax=Polaribacter sp. Z022 TaxID=2927125 RepID=UPI00202035B0|nr:hypothetical protein [Polaribacter sp. Z022]MCL7752816.1 hypothetical protein [Polaribacter sp. Z022]
MYINKRQKNKKEKKAIYNYKLAFFSFLLAFYSLNSLSQDSIPVAEDLTEEKELKFQQFFFKALSEKSIGNYQKAIENLESCNQILNENNAVFFEFSKNYFQLNKTLLAKEYINRALIKEPSNIWMLKHLVKINIKEKDFSEAIRNQKKVVVLNLKERELLLRLYLRNRDYENAVLLMDEMEQENALSSNFKSLKLNLEKKTRNTVKKQKVNDSDSLIEQFKTDKSYQVLKQLLELYKTNPQILLKYSTEGMALFPAQPYVYLMNGKALNYQKSYKKALLSLQNGIDFVIEDKMEADFYKEMAISYKNLGMTKEQKKVIEKSKKLKS